jgi:uncharacterized protein YjiS (DUF1127 family)
MEIKMANVTISHNSRDLSGPAGRSVLTVIADFVARVARRLKNRREMNQLLAMSDYQLRDIGIQRGDIQREAVRSLWR